MLTICEVNGKQGIEEHGMPKVIASPVRLVAEKNQRARIYATRNIT